jgi:hypothetical protein
LLASSFGEQRKRGRKPRESRIRQDCPFPTLDVDPGHIAAGDELEDIDLLDWDRRLSIDRLAQFRSRGVNAISVIVLYWHWRLAPDPGAHRAARDLLDAAGYQVVLDQPHGPDPHTGLS